MRQLHAFLLVKLFLFYMTMAISVQVDSINMEILKFLKFLQSLSSKLPGYLFGLLAFKLKDKF